MGIYAPINPVIYDVQKKHDININISVLMFIKNNNIGARFVLILTNLASVFGGQTHTLIQYTGFYHLTQISYFM